MNQILARSMLCCSRRSGIHGSRRYEFRKRGAADGSFRCSRATIEYMLKRQPDKGVGIEF